MALNQSQKAILLMLGSAVSFPAMGLLAKAGTGHFPATELILFRGGISTLLTVILLAIQGDLAAMRTKSPWVQICAGVLWAASSTSFFASLAYLPFATSVALCFILPMVSTLASVLFLGERTRPANWIAMAVGLAGVLVISPPGAGWGNPGILLALANPILYCCGVILVRKMGSNESGNTTSFYSLLCSMAVGATGLPFGWVTPGLADIPMLFGIGFFALLGTFLIVASLRRAPVRTVMPFFYAQAISSVFGGWIFFAELPPLATFIGMVLIIASGLMTYGLEGRGKA